MDPQQDGCPGTASAEAAFQGGCLTWQSSCHVHTLHVFSQTFLYSRCTARILLAPVHTSASLLMCSRASCSFIGCLLGSMRASALKVEHLMNHESYSCEGRVPAKASQPKRMQTLSSISLLAKACSLTRHSV